MTTTPFAAGQRWLYRTRPQEPTSTVLILRRDDTEQGTILHIRVDGVQLPHPGPPGTLQTELGHAPITEAALRASVTELVQTAAAVPTDDSGYQTWRAAADRGEAGVFTLTVAEVLDTLTEALAPRPAVSDLFRKSGRR